MIVWVQFDSTIYQHDDGPDEEYSDDEVITSRFTTITVCGGVGDPVLSQFRGSFYFATFEVSSLGIG